MNLKESRTMSVSHLERQATIWSAMVAAGNAGLLIALGANPLPSPGWQMAFGIAALATHGWGVWEIGRNWRHLIDLSKQEAISARLDLAAFAREKRSEIATRRPGRE